VTAAFEPVRPRDAATVMLVRDQPAGMEVFMLRRNLNSDFVGGAYVFPGGKVDDADRTDDLTAVCDGRTDEGASDVLGVEQGGLAFWVAAIRECFEEAGVLLAFPRTSDERLVLSLADQEIASRYRTYRAAVYAGTLRLVDLCQREGLYLDARRIHYFSHWITPEGGPRRYDTRFFVAAAPPEQVPLHDDGETIAHLWIRPADALERHDKGELEMILPTIKNLEAISRFERSADLLAAAEAVQQPAVILPRVIQDSEGFRIVLPGDPAYDAAVLVPLPAGFPEPGQVSRPGISDASRASGGDAGRGG
jgi:8-oxo-dGTP pyrophosphatase MutT (NUDIX family)